MTSRDFCYWLQGFFEVADPIQLGKAQTEMIRKHLSLVFKHEIDPSMGNQDHQNELNQIHSTTFPDWGPQPHEGWMLSKLHGWYNPEEGTPRC